MSGTPARIAPATSAVKAGSEKAPLASNDRLITGRRSRRAVRREVAAAQLAPAGDPLGQRHEEQRQADEQRA